MSNLIANRNTLQMLQGVQGFNEWYHWVFDKSLTQIENECEDIWLERLLHTTMAVMEQIEFIEQQRFSDISKQQSQVQSLTKRLKTLVNIIDFVPSVEGTGNFEYLLNKPPQASDKAISTKLNISNKLLQVVALYISEHSDTSITAIWSYFYSKQGDEIKELIEVISVSDETLPHARMRWLDAVTGVEGNSITRKSMATAVSRIKFDLKSN